MVTLLEVILLLVTSDYCIRGYFITSVNPVPNAQVKGEQHLPKHMG